MRRALVVRGGWEGHQPAEATEMFVPFLREHGFAVRVEESTEVYADEAVMADADLIVQCVTMSSITREQVAGLRTAVASGTGFTGWHGGIADSYRNNSDYLQLVGGQFADVVDDVVRRQVVGDPDLVDLALRGHQQFAHRLAHRRQPRGEA